MRIDILTLFPEVCRAPLNESMMKRAQESGALDLRIHNLRDWEKGILRDKCLVLALPVKNDDDRS